MKKDDKITALKEEDVKKRLEDLTVKLKSLDVNPKDLVVDLEELETIWISWYLFKAQQTRGKKKKVKPKFTKFLISTRQDLEDLWHRLFPDPDDRFLDTLNINQFHNFLRSKILSFIQILEEIFTTLRKIFKVNDFLTLKLVGDSTYIYIKEKRFIQCIRLSLQIPPQTRHLYEEIESIDEAAEVYKQTLWQNRIVEGPMARPSRFQNRSITPEQEFLGHCSNIQAWAEHDYDTRLLHSNLSFPLLKALSDAGDPKAKAIFQEEIAIRLEGGYPSVVNYLLEQRYLRYLDKDQLKTLLRNYADVDDDEFLEDIYNAEMIFRYRLKNPNSKFRKKKAKNTLLIVRSKSEIFDLKTLKLFLELGEYDPITCSNAKEALKVIEERYNDIVMILLDPMMPRLNKEKLLQFVKSDERYKHILVTFLPKDFTSDRI